MLARLNLIAVLLAPVVAWLIDEDTLTLRDALQLLIVVALAAAVLAGQLVGGLWRWVQWRPAYTSVDHQYFYSTDGTVTTRSTFDYVNGWGRRSDLPAENLVWFRRITSSDLVYRVCQRDSFREHDLRSAAASIDPVGFAADCRDDNNYFFSWTPHIHPPLRRKERVRFMVEIIAERTETAAFTAAGTRLGIGVQQPTRRAEITAYAPFGYRFVLIEPRLTLRDARTLDQLPNRGPLPEPEVSPDGSVLSLALRRPRRGCRYWVHYRFEPVRT